MNSIIKNIFFLFLIIGIGSCQSGDSALAESISDTGVAGSYARFLVVNDFMYIIDDSDIKTFDVSTPSNPNQINEQEIGERIESIFNYEDKLFIGSGSGLYIYQIANDGLPSLLSETQYFDWGIFPCDPVVANSEYAYVTLNSKSRVESPCGGSQDLDLDVLRIFDINDIENPVLINEYSMNAPKGVGIDGETLFICDDTEGLKVFDVSDPEDIVLMQQFDDFTAFDVIPLDGLLLVVGPDNVYQFDYTDLNNITLISVIPYGA